MAVTNTFKRAYLRDLGTTPTSITNITNVASTQIVVMGMIVANKNEAHEHLLLTVELIPEGEAAVVIVHKNMIPKGESYIVIGWDQKLVLSTNDDLRFTVTGVGGASVTSSADVTVSYLEINVTA